ncbi:MAG TPA: DNA-binding protein WhiA [Defluviitoga tunisiensis]|nr:DNA-binding protein WhiA [Defluviitoga tunisiensis]
MYKLSSFSEKVKLSLVNSKILFPEAEFFGFFVGRGESFEYHNEKLIKIKATSMNSLKRLYKITKIFYPEKIEYKSYNDKRLDLGSTGIVYLNKELIEKSLNDFCFSFEKDKFPPFLKKDPLIFGSFLKGLFLSCGSISVKNSYHMEFNLQKINKSFLNDIAKTFRDLVGVKANLLIKDEKAKIYIKAREDILNILELLGAKEAVSELYKLIGVRNIRGNVTRTVNLISANAEKTVKSSLKQINDILTIDKTIGLESLPDDLKQVAFYRLNNREASLSTIAEALGIKKSTLYHKFNKISKIANSLDSAGEND